MSRNHGFVELFEFDHSEASIHIPSESSAWSDHIPYVQLSCHLSSALRRLECGCGGPHFLPFQYLTLNPRGLSRMGMYLKAKGLVDLIRARKRPYVSPGVRRCIGSLRG